MALQQPQITTLIIPEEKKRSLNIKGIVTKYLYYWPLFVIALFVTLAAALVYLHFAKPTYLITATLIIKDEKKAPDQQSALSEIDLVNSSKLIENEMEVIKSNRLISQVVNELELGIVYKEKNGLKSFDLYKTSPVKLILLNTSATPKREATKEDKKELTVVIKDKSTFFLKNEDDQLKEYAFIYGRDNLNDSIVDVQEIKDALDIPVIGEISFEKSQSLIAIQSAGTNVISEQLRTLRTNLYYLYGDKITGRVTLITSSIPGEGKSSISGNLGMTLAHIERKTVILEMDLRRTRLKDNFNMAKDGPGITEFLNDKATLQQIIHQSEMDPNLHIIGSGAIANNSSELLEKQQLKTLIATLRNTYDDIIIDSPPDRTELDFLKELNNKKHLTDIQIVFNGVERAKYGYGYKYNNSYYN